MKELLASKGVNMEGEEAMVLKVVTRQRPVKTQQTEKLSMCCSEL
jgi:hypothetical protein